MGDQVIKRKLQILSIALVLLLTAATGAAQVITRVSEAVAGGAGNGDSRLTYSRWAVSSDGRYVAFESDATDLVADDTNGVTDVFVRDVELGITTRVSVDLDGENADGPSEDPSISADGRYVAFVSDAANLVEGDGNGVADVFVRDLHRGTTVRVSVDTEGGDADDLSNRPSISADGRVVAFGSHATDLVDGDGHGVAQVFVRDLDLGETERVSVGSGGGGGDANSWAPAISADGRHVAFSSVASNLTADPGTAFREVYVRDLQAEQTIWVSVGRDGGSPNGGSIGPSLSEHGRFVSFRSDATDLVEGDTNGQDDIFIRDLVTGVTTRVNVSSDGAQVIGAGSYHASISGDGRYVVFMSDGENLVSGDTNGWGDVFGHDRATGATTLLSVGRNGDRADGFSRWPVTTPDGLFVVFESTASNLVADDTNGVMDVFLAAGPAAAADHVRIFPGAASAPGVGTSFWVTDVRLFNPDPVISTTVWLSALLRDADNTGVEELPVTIEARSGVALNDVLANFFGLGDSAAAIRMRSEAPFLATSRTYNVGGDVGTYGSFIPSFGPEDALDRGILLHVINRPGKPGFRTNVGFANPGLSTVAVTVKVFDADDRTMVGSGSLDLAPRTFAQINDVFKFIGQRSRETSNATVEFAAGAPVLAYASVIDNESDDSIFVVPGADQGTPPP